MPMCITTMNVFPAYVLKPNCMEIIVWEIVLKRWQLFAIDGNLIAWLCSCTKQKYSMRIYPSRWKPQRLIIDRDISLSYDRSAIFRTFIIFHAEIVRLLFQRQKLHFNHAFYCMDLDMQLTFGFSSFSYSKNTHSFISFFHVLFILIAQFDCPNGRGPM